MAEIFDAIVVGAGGSGLAAAYSAAEQGGRVLVLEKRPQPGGTTGIAVGSFSAAGTSLQQQAGINDNPEHHIEDVGKFAPDEIEAPNDDVALNNLVLHHCDTSQTSAAHRPGDVKAMAPQNHSRKSVLPHRV